MERNRRSFDGQDVRFEDENGDLQEYDPSLVRVTGSKSEQGEDLKGLSV